MPLKFSDDAKRKLLQAIQSHWLDEYEEEIGELKSDRLFEFFLELIGASSYNQGVEDAQAYLQGKLIDLEIDLHEEVHGA